MTPAEQHRVGMHLLPNGTVKFTITPVNPDGTDGKLPEGTPPVMGSVADASGAPSSALTLAPSPEDTSGFGLIQIGTGVQEAQGLVVTFSTTLPGASSPIEGVGDPIDIQAAPQLPSGFRVTES